MVEGKLRRWVKLHSTFAGLPIREACHVRPRTPGFSSDSLDATE